MIILDVSQRVLFHPLNLFLFVRCFIGSKERCSKVVQLNMKTTGELNALSG